MNFADLIKKEIEKAEAEKDEGRAFVAASMEAWKKPLSIGNITEAIKDACNELAEETEDPLVILVGMMINIKLIETLFPREEFEAYKREMKGEE